MQLELNEKRWDCCVVGNGVSALWVAHWLWSSKKSVLWITSEEPYSPERALLQHGWAWNLPESLANRVTASFGEFAHNPFEVIYYDARTKRRFLRYDEPCKREFGDHEAAFFKQEFAAHESVAVENAIAESTESTSGAPVDAAAAAPREATLDLWAWQKRLHAFHDTGQVTGLNQVELFSEPRFVRVQGWPIAEIHTTDKKITSLTFASKTETPVTIEAEQFFIGDFDDALASHIKNHEDSQVLSAALKGRAYRAGFGLRLWHKNMESYPTQTAVMPLVANPSEKGAMSHVIGRFQRAENSELVESLWFGFLTDAEIEDNNEILKKIKQAKRAIERAVPGFADSIVREAVTFEPKMRAQSLVRRRKAVALGAVLLSDHFGPEYAAQIVERVLSGQVYAHEEALSAEDLAEIEKIESHKAKSARKKKGPKEAPRVTAAVVSGT